jgi:hypothetical protein
MRGNDTDRKAAPGHYIRTQPGVVSDMAERIRVNLNSNDNTFTGSGPRMGWSPIEPRHRFESLTPWDEVARRYSSGNGYERGAIVLLTPFPMRFPGLLPLICLS